MNLKQMEYFITIVNEGSISAASKILHISQPPLSTQMKLLEQELGVTLFERGSRAIALTHAGKVFYDRAQGILDMTGAARQELEQMGRGLHGFLRLGGRTHDGRGDAGTFPGCGSGQHQPGTALHLPADYLPALGRGA